MENKKIKKNSASDENVRERDRGQNESKTETNLFMKWAKECKCKIGNTYEISLVRVKRGEYITGPFARL